MGVTVTLKVWASIPDIGTRKGALKGTPIDPLKDPLKGPLCT